MRGESEQTGAWGVDMKQAHSGDSSCCKPGEKLHLLVGSPTWARLTAETCTGRNRVRGRGEGGTEGSLHWQHHLPAHKMPRWQQTQAALIQPRLSVSRIQQAHQRLSPQQRAGIALPRAKRASPPLSNISKAHMRTRGRSDLTSPLMPLNNKNWAISLIYIITKRNLFRLNRYYSISAWRRLSGPAAEALPVAILLLVCPASALPEEWNFIFRPLDSHTNTVCFLPFLYSSTNFCSLISHPLLPGKKHNYKSSGFAATHMQMPGRTSIRPHRHIRIQHADVFRCTQVCMHLHQEVGLSNIFMFSAVPVCSKGGQLSPPSSSVPLREGLLLEETLISSFPSLWALADRLYFF